MTILPTLIQSVATTNFRDVTQPGSDLPLPTVPVQAAPLPIPQASSPLAAGNSASSVSDAPPSSTPRPLTGFLATLSDAQRKAALEYDGPETHGDPAFMNIDPAFLAATRETQYGPNDMEAR